MKPVDPQAIVVFGATGDLTRRKLLPAFYHLFLADLLPRNFAAKVGAALRNQFGGHAVRAVERAKAGPDPR